MMETAAARGRRDCDAFENVDDCAREESCSPLCVVPEIVLERTEKTGARVHDTFFTMEETLADVAEMETLETESEPEASTAAASM